MSTNEELYADAEKLKDEGKLEEAVTKLEAIVAQSPDYALAHSALAVYLGRVKRHSDAVAHALKACELEPNDPFSFTALSVTYQRAGMIPEAEYAKAKASTMTGHHH